jgi:hypothetical protein
MQWYGFFPKAISTPEQAHEREKSSEAAALKGHD